MMTDEELDAEALFEEARERVTEAVFRKRYAAELAALDAEPWDLRLRDELAMLRDHVGDRVHNVWIEGYTEDEAAWIAAAKRDLGVIDEDGGYVAADRDCEEEH